jgi:hopanoid C-3 methylase
MDAPAKPLGSRLKRFYEELVKTQAVLNRKHLAFVAFRQNLGTALRLLLRWQTNFIRMHWKFHKVCNPELQYADHFQEVDYALSPPPVQEAGKSRLAQLYVHTSIGDRRGG